MTSIHNNLFDGDFISRPKTCDSWAGCGLAPVVCRRHPRSCCCADRV